MAMSELKQRLLKIELAKIGFPNAIYIPESDKIKVQPDDDRLPFIDDAGSVFYGSEYGPLVKQQILPFVDKINEILAAFEKAPYAPFEDAARYRILSEYNDIVLAARDDSEKGYGYGFEFATWQYNSRRTGFEEGKYTTDYESAKQKFAVRAGLVNRNKLFDETEMKLIRQGLVHLGANFPDLTHEQNTLLGKVVERIEMLVPEICEHEDLERDALVPDDGLEV